MQNNKIPSALYRIAGRNIQVTPALPGLQSFCVGEHEISLPLTFSDLAAITMQPPLLRGQGLLYGRNTNVQVWKDEHGFLLGIASVGFFWTKQDGSKIYQVSLQNKLSPNLLIQALVGPPLILALALQGIWCLHASAIEINGRVYAFLGGSGTGKSTLAAWLAQQPAIHLVADDILPVTIHTGLMFASPHFPQLKLPGGKQYASGLPENLPLGKLYLLEEDTRFLIQRTSSVNAALTIAGNTAASRLFEPILLSNHLDFCSQAASAVPVSRLMYPRQLTELPAVWQILESDLTGGND